MPIKKLLYAAIVLGCLVASAALVAGVMAETYPALDIVNNGLPLLATGLAVLLLLSAALRSRALIITTAGLLAVALAVLIPSLSSSAQRAPIPTIARYIDQAEVSGCCCGAAAVMRYPRRRRIRAAG